ncbi:DUF1365 domain-containing protein [Kribbella sp. NPDC055071]
MTRVPAVPALVIGTVRHGRAGPVRHAFRHGVYQWLVDLDDLPRLPWYLRHLARFDVRDHFAGTGPAIKDDLRRFLTAHGVHFDGRVVMLANARVLGHVFNPLSVFWCIDHAGRTLHVVAEVHNTYGERHVYLLDLDESGAAEIDKEFYVSPFNDVSGRYRMDFHLDATRIRVSISLSRHGKQFFGAGFDGVPRPATRRAVLATAVRMPLMPQRVSALIRLHGVWLWARRLPVVSRPVHAVQKGIQ